LFIYKYYHLIFVLETYHNLETD